MVQDLGISFGIALLGSIAGEVVRDRATVKKIFNIGIRAVAGGCLVGLAEVAGFQADLLRGRADPDRLRRLAGLSEGEMPPDPHLAEALAAISLRAKVELARLEVRGRGA